MLPFGNYTVIETLTGAQLRAGLLNGLSPACNTQVATGRFPQVAGLTIAYHCSGTTPVIDTLLKGGAPLADADTVRIVTNDFMFTGGDGYTALSQGTDVIQQPDEPLLDVVVDWIAANSPVAPTVEGRITKG